LRNQISFSALTEQRSCRVACSDGYPASRWDRHQNAFKIFD